MSEELKNSKHLNHLFWRMATQDDEAALKEMFFDFYPALCVFAQRYIGCSETCRDIVQETFYKIWKKRKQIDINTSFRNFLITSVRNECTDYLRKKKLSETYIKKATQTQSVSPEEIYTLGELHQMITDALQKLPENARKAFDMSRFQNMTYTQISDEMNLSVKTIESYISRALKILREDLKDFRPYLFFIL